MSSSRTSSSSSFLASFTRWCCFPCSSTQSCRYLKGMTVFYTNSFRMLSTNTFHHFIADEKRRQKSRLLKAATVKPNSWLPKFSAISCYLFLFCSSPMSFCLCQCSIATLSLGTICKVQSVPDLTDDSLCNVNKTKRLTLLTDAAPNTFQLKKKKTLLGIGLWRSSVPSALWRADKNWIPSDFFHLENTWCWVGKRLGLLMLLTFIENRPSSLALTVDRKSLCVVNKIKGLTSLTDTVPNISQVEQNRCSLTLRSSVEYWVLMQ